MIIIKYKSNTILLYYSNIMYNIINNIKCNIIIINFNNIVILFEYILREHILRHYNTYMQT